MMELNVLHFLDMSAAVYQDRKLWKRFMVEPNYKSIFLNRLHFYWLRFRSFDKCFEKSYKQSSRSLSSDYL